jgi:hypothetical protein
VYAAYSYLNNPYLVNKGVGSGWGQLERIRQRPDPRPCRQRQRAGLAVQDQLREVQPDCAGGGA